MMAMPNDERLHRSLALRPPRTVHDRFVGAQAHWPALQRAGRRGRLAGPPCPGRSAVASGLSACLNVDGTRYAASLYPAGLRAEADTAALAVGGRRVGTRPGQPCPAAYARWRLAEALLVARMDHERAEGAVRDAGTLGSGGRRFQFGTRAF